ncbi:MAG: 2-oxo-4-hydroxy-4-carboxy-5-ureidoimidazoline decarboxylase, partial [Pseudomonadota bacterium]
MSREAFVARYGGIYEHSAWVAERAYDGGADEADDLAPIFRRIVERAGRDAQLALLRAHPDLAGRLGTALTTHSSAEQAGAGLAECSAEEYAEFQALNTRYTERFGFPFIIAVKGRGRQKILTAFRGRVEGEPEAEFSTALDEVHKIAAFRLAAPAAPPPPREAIALDDLHALALAALRRAGADDENAAAIADTVIAADRDGSESHGVFRLPGYLAGLRDGRLNGVARPAIISAEGAAVVVDGDAGSAQLAYRLALPVLAERAAAGGAAVLALRNAVHFAAMWHEVEWLAERGLIGFACTPSFAYVAPHGGKRPFFGTNPIAFAYPAAPHPMVFDFAAAAMARGDIMIAARDGRPVPRGVGIDEHGAPTQDPAAILKGAQLPVGAHKGSAIALMVELLAGATVGDIFSIEASAADSAAGLPRGGVFMLALAPERLGGPDATTHASAWLQRLAAEPGVRLPGSRRHARRAAGGPVHIPVSLLEALRE